MELPKATLKVQLWDFKRFSEHEPLGELQLPLGTMDLQHVLESWYQLGPPGTTEVSLTGRGPGSTCNMGEAEVGVLYLLSPNPEG